MVDARIEAVRRDLADVRLAERVFSPHYAAPIARGVLARTPLLAHGDAGAAPLSELLPGERFEMLELTTDFAWGISATDGTVGYVATAALGDAVAPTHRVRAVRAAIRAEARADAAETGALPMGARVAATVAGGWAQVPGGFVAVSDLLIEGEFLTDYVASAESLVGVAWRAGGRSGAGVDATGLVFLALDMAGFPCPRFCDLQARALGRAIAPGEEAARGDLVYFAEHVAILTDSDTAVHAGSGAVERISVDALVGGGAHGDIVARRRLV
ncbi:MAG: C40 family peptidase [Pseudomonadota bacterium]